MDLNTRTVRLQNIRYGFHFNRNSYLTLPSLSLELILIYGDLDPDEKQNKKIGSRDIHLSILL